MHLSPPHHYHYHLLIPNVQQHIYNCPSPLLSIVTDPWRNCCLRRLRLFDHLLFWKCAHWYLQGFDMTIIHHHHKQNHYHQPELSEIEEARCEAAATLVAGGFNRFPFLLRKMN